MSLPKPYYEKDGIVIYCADCREILPYLPKVDLCLTDPPYGIGADRGSGGSNMARVNIYEGGWDDKPIDNQIITHMMALSQWQIIFGGNYYAMPPSSCWLVWDKDNTGGFADCELAWTNIPKAVRRIRYRWNGMLQENMKAKEDRVHPTQKPVPVMAWCIGQAPKADTILDPFMGSGTTLVVAKQLGRRAIGIEIEEKYCQIAVKRLAQDVLPFNEPEEIYTQGVLE